MNELTTDLKTLHEATLNNLKSSKANNTLRAYKSDFKDFGAFCAKHGLNSLPSEPKIVSLYLTHLSKNSKISTLRRRLVSISMVHKLKGHYLDTKHPIIVENLMGIKRVKGSIQKGKKPILINHLKSIINVIDEQKIDEIKKARDKALLFLLYGAGLRISEALSIYKNQCPLGDWLRVEGKGGKHRDVPILKIVSETIQDYLSLLPKQFLKEEYLFIGKRGGKLSPRIIQRIIELFHPNKE